MFSVLQEDLQVNAKDEYLQGVDVDSDSDQEDDDIRDTDLVFAVTNAEEDHCSIEVYVFSEEEHAMFVHHDMLLGAYPLCSTVLPAVDRALLAVGSFDSAVELWDVNLEDA